MTAIRPALVTLAVLSSATAHAAPLTAEQVAAQAISAYFQPGYHQVMTEARNLERVARDLCESPDAKRLATVRAHFATLVEAWSRIELVRFGPVLRDSQLERILFWPDRRGIGLRQVQAILASKDTTATDPASLHTKSVAAQGLGALEYTLFGTGAATLASGADPFRCRYALAIAGNIADVAGTLNAQWSAADGIAAQFTHPAPDNPAYHTGQEVLNEIIGVLAHGLEAIRDTRLTPMLGDAPASAKPKAALYWRSRQTFASIRANFAGLRVLFDHSLAAALPDDKAWLVNSVHFEFGNAERALSAVTVPIERAVVDEEPRGKLTYTVIVSQSLRRIVGQDIASALGLSVGFSSADGD